MPDDAVDPGVASRLERQLAEAGLQVSVEASEDALVVSGLVETEEARQAVLDLVASWAPDARIDDGLEPERKVEICEHVWLILDLAGKECVGFTFGPLSEFDFEALAADCAADGVWEFLFVAPGLLVTGAVGTPLSPIAIK